MQFSLWAAMYLFNKLSIYLATESEVLTGKSQTKTRPRFEFFP